MNQPSPFEYTPNTPFVTSLLTATRDMSLLRVERQGLTNMHDLAGRVFLAVAHTQAPVLLISQSSAEGNFCFVIPRDCTSRVLEAIRCELRLEIEQRYVAAISVVEDVAVVSGHAGLCDCLAQAGVSCLVYAQGTNSSSAVIASADIHQVANRGVGQTFYADADTARITFHQ